MSGARALASTTDKPPKNELANHADACEHLIRMQMPNDESPSRPKPLAAENQAPPTNPDFSSPPKPIAEFVTRPDFPECTLGQHVDIGGFTGIVTAIVKQSLKVRSPEGATRSFNSFGLRRIHGPPPDPEPLPPIPAAAPSAPHPARHSSSPAKPSPPPPPPREIIEEPNFDQPIIPIASLVKSLDFPKCAFGRHVDVGGYNGVVVEIVNQSLKIRSRQGTSRSYNAAGLRNIYGKS